MHSMTGFASEVVEARDRRWLWEAKSVNGRGLDLRLRVSDVAEADEAALRAEGGKRLSRGSVTVFLKEDGVAPGGALVVNEVALNAVLQAAKLAEQSATDIGLDVSTSSIAEFLAIRGVVEPAAEVGSEEATKEIDAALQAGFANLMTSLIVSRATEGERLASTLSGQIDQIEVLMNAAQAEFQTQMSGAPSRLADKVAAVLDSADVDPDRLAQELALLAVKADVTEELDRLATHIAAARDLLKAKGPVGRKFDFLTQEFNREVNTLCSKSGSSVLTQIGLDLKVIVDQMREQAANVE